MNKRVPIALTFTILLLLTVNLSESNAQPYFHLNRAEKLIDKNKRLGWALYHLRRAEAQDYGWCGNAWAEAYWGISYNRARVYYQRGKYKKALQELDSIETCMLGGYCKKSDSLKMQTLLSLYDTSTIREAIQPHLEDEYRLYNIYFGIEIPLESISYTLVIGQLDSILTKEIETFTLHEILKLKGWNFLIE